VLGPQSTVLLVLLVAGFGALMWWMVATRLVLLRVLAAGMAFMLAMLVGVLAVNRYYGYYQSWGSAAADLTNQGAGPGVRVSARMVASGSRSDALTGPDIYLQLARQQGYTLHLALTGPLSHITRTVYVYLPPEYFQPAYRSYRFPVVELIHGQPGEPQDWINVVGVTVTLDHLLNQKLAQPAVLVMPDANGGQQVSLQCLNQVGGPQDLTYLAQDLPVQVARLFRVQPPGPAWGVAGYSEGGFCAANMALRFPSRYGGAGVLSGYFAPMDNRLASSSQPVSPFGGSRRLRLEDTPVDEVQQLPTGAAIPRFWIGAGRDNGPDADAAEFFWQELQLRQANVPLTLTPGGGHNMGTWRAEVPPMLRWMTSVLASAVPDSAAAQARTAAVRRGRAPARAASTMTFRSHLAGALRADHAAAGPPRRAGHPRPG